MTSQKSQWIPHCPITTLPENALPVTPSSPPTSFLPVSSKNSPEPTLMPLYLPPHSPSFLSTTPHLPLPRHRAINFFIPVYQRLWIEAEEYSFEEKLVQDLAVSTGLTLPSPRVPCVGTPLPVLSAECFFSAVPVEPWERARVGTSPKASRGPRPRRAKPFKQRSVRGQRLHDQLRRHRASSGARSSRKAGFAVLTAVVRRAFRYSRRLLLAVGCQIWTQPISCLFAVLCKSVVCVKVTLQCVLWPWRQWHARVVM